MALRFTDGVTIDTAGPLRQLRLQDGLYVVGRGMLIPVKDEVEAKATIEELSATKSKPAPDPGGIEGAL
jgi:hypothetical protein